MTDEIEYRCEKCGTILQEKDKYKPDSSKPIKDITAETPITQSIVSSTATSSQTAMTTLLPMGNKAPKIISNIVVYICPNPECSHENQIIE